MAAVIVRLMLVDISVIPPIMSVLKTPSSTHVCGSVMISPSSSSRPQ